MPASSKKFDVGKFIRREFNASKEAVFGLLHHGQIKIDGHVIKPEWMTHWTEDQVRGRILTIPQGSKRILGMRPIDGS